LMCRGALCWFQNVTTWRSYWILNNFFIKNHLNWNRKLERNLGTLLVWWKAWLRFNESNLEFFRLKVWEILIFEYLLSLEICINYKKMVLDGKISSVMSSHLGQWCTLHLYMNLWKKVLFVRHIGSPKSCRIWQHTWYHWKALELNVLTYNEKAIEYTTTFSLKIHLNQH
jgi:hypothetical protein